MPILQNSAPYWTVPGAALYLGDVRACLRALPARSVHCVVTSPPYWGLRDYGMDINAQIGSEPSPDCGTHGKAQCGGCFVCSLVGVFDQVKRVLRDDGTVWLNLGDTFDDGQLLIPSRVALALASNGWKLVQDIIWYSPNKMPESVMNRCAKSHEHIFLLAKDDNYYFDNEAIRVSANENNKPHKYTRAGENNPYNSQEGNREDSGNWGRTDTANKRDVWIVPTQPSPFKGVHFATFSPRLITPCILAGTSEYGCCAACGKPYERIVSKTGAEKAEPDEDGRDRSFNWSRNGKTGSLDGTRPTRETVGWQKVCGCSTQDVKPALILDPFVGSGTTVATALLLGRHGVGIDLSETYLREAAIPRIEAALRGEKAPRKPTVAYRPSKPPPPKPLR